MALPVHTFGGSPTFLGTVRTAMDANGGVFAARDGVFRYVFLDATSSLLAVGA